MHLTMGTCKNDKKLYYLVYIFCFLRVSFLCLLCMWWVKWSHKGHSIYVRPYVSFPKVSGIFQLNVLLGVYAELRWDLQEQDCIYAE